MRVVCAWPTASLDIAIKLMCAVLKLKNLPPLFTKCKVHLVYSRACRKNVRHSDHPLFALS